MVRLVTFASPDMSRSMELCCESAMKNGVNVCWPQSPETLDKGFVRHNRNIFDQPRGYGLWLWKPLIIYEAMTQPSVNQGDILIYSDAGQEFVDSVYNVINCMTEDVMLFTNGFANMEWCKGDVIKWILPEDYEKYIASGSHEVILQSAREFKQVQASLIIFRVTPSSISFVKTWLMLCQLPGLIDDSPGRHANFPTFADHRHDQAILTCLARREGIRQHWFPSRTNMHRQEFRLLTDIYPAIVNHHRKRNHEW